MASKERLWKLFHDHLPKDPLLKAHSLDGSWKMATRSQELQSSQGRDREIMRKNQPAVRKSPLYSCTSSQSWIFSWTTSRQEGNRMKAIAPKRRQELGIIIAVGEFSEMLFALLIAHSSFHHGGAPPILPLSPFVFFYAISCRKIDDGERHR